MAIKGETECDLQHTARMNISYPEQSDIYDNFYGFAHNIGFKFRLGFLKLQLCCCDACPLSNDS
jgi:hypothetical protein